MSEDQKVVSIIDYINENNICNKYLNKINDIIGNSNVEVLARVKDKESALQKMQVRNFAFANQISDFIGYMLITDKIEDVYKIRNKLKNTFGNCIEEDYIKNPKSTGYMSYHLIVLVPIYLNETVEHVEAEIQIRTSAMDFWASIDHKVQYKFPSEIPEEVKKEMYNCSLDIRKLDEKMQQLNEFVNKYNKE